MRSSYLWAMAFCLAIAAWFASGNLEALGLAKNPPVSQEASAPASKQKKQLFRVEVRRFEASLRPSVIVVRGRTELEKKITVRARTSGIVEETAVREGDHVRAGDLLCRLDMRDRKAKLAQARAQLASARRDFEAARKLARIKFASRAKLASEQARLDAAKAAVEQINQDIGWTRITSPLTGIVIRLDGERGSFLQPGQPCAVVAVFDPLLVTAQVSERDIAKIRLGQKATARLVTGETITGRVTFIAPTSDLATRTFRVEAETANPGYRLRDGITAEISFPLKPEKAHLIPAGIISLNDAGETVVRTLGKGNRVVSMPVRLIAQTRQGAWVSGLPDKADIIIAGQDYVLDGQIVEPARSPASGSDKPS
ncbi:MAG TPA: efflux RND transporter periplasmic adaptor subunit [Rhizobiales bacterium]|nr:efflux RND transporter periplasmic adaptor subunit [Hyphomicrobiales bacterium]